MALGSVSFSVEMFSLKILVFLMEKTIWFLGSCKVKVQWVFFSLRSVEAKKINIFTF